MTLNIAAILSDFNRYNVPLKPTLPYPQMRPQQQPTTDHIENWKVLKNLLPYLSEFKWRVFAAIFFLIAAKLANIGLPFVIKYVVDQLSGSVDPSKGSSLTSVFGTDISLVWLLAPFGLIVVYGSLRFLSIIFGEIRDTLFGRVTERAMRRIGQRVFIHLHKLDLDFHLNRKTGGLSRDIERGTTGISFLMRFMVFNIVPTLFEILMVIGILLYNYGFEFAVVTLSAIAIYIIYSVKVTEWRNGFLRAANKADSDSSSQAIDSLLNYETVKYYTNEDFEAKRYDHNLVLWEQARRKNRLSLFALNGGQALIIAVAMTTMMLLAGKGVQDGAMTIGDFVLVNAFMMQIFMPLNFLGFVYREIKMSLINIEQMFKLLNIKPKVRDAENATSLKISNGEISFQRLDFSYQTERTILNNISFNISSGETIAVVGASGSGKSTLVKMLFRFYDPTNGQILIDGQDISQVTQISLRKAIGVVPQDTVLFNDSILENIRYGRPEATDDEVQQAIELAHLSHFIDQLPDGTNTKVGERGLKLSGGEKQRVAIARTILKRPPIMIFDEATSSLDSKSEQMILKSINELSKNTTSLIIAHRLSTIVNADKIIVLDKGRIVEQGTHKGLIENSGAYFELWDAQQKKT